MIMPADGAARASWLVPLADLSMILFVVTGASLAAAPRPQAQESAGQQQAGGFVQSVPVAVLVDAPDSPPLGDWLARYGQDPTGLLTIEGRYAAAADRAQVAGRAEVLAGEARAAGVEPRVVVEPGPATGVTAVLAYDRDPQMAQDLLEEAQHRLP